MKVTQPELNSSNQSLDQKNQTPPQKNWKKKIFWGVSLGVYALIIAGGAAFIYRYRTTDAMQVPIRELSSKDYPAEPVNHSIVYNRYANRQLKIVQKDATHFNFILESSNPRAAKIILNNINLELIVPKVPEAAKTDQNLERLALVSREWNRQQLIFTKDSEHLEIIGGDGFEKENIYSVELARNCLNSGLWEIFLNTKEEGEKKQYYHGWFNFPLGYYKSVFEKINQISYWKYWLQLERWQNPAGEAVNLEALRTIENQQEVSAEFPQDERIIVAGEQGRKIKNILATNLVTWKDFYQTNQNVRFATFRKPGFYDPKTPWGNQYWRIGKFEKAILREVKPKNTTQNLQEIEFTFSDTRTGENNRILVSGINLKTLPQLPVKQYSQGLYLPIGISLPPFSQTYEELKENPPTQNPYFSAILDEKSRWIDNHSFGVDGVVMHRDQQNPALLHAYLLSYERHTLISHYLIDLKDWFVAQGEAITPIPVQTTTQVLQQEMETPSVHPILIIPTEEQWSCYHQGKGGKACFWPGYTEPKKSENPSKK